MKLTEHFKVGLAMAMPIRRSDHTDSGFVVDEGTKQPLFSMARVEGYAEALRTGYVDRLIVVGGDEAAYLPGEKISRPEAIMRILIDDYRVGPRVGYLTAPPNTKGVIKTMAASARANGPTNCVYLSSHFHIDRSLGDFRKEEKLEIAGRGAEALLLVDHLWTPEKLLKYFGGGPYAETVVKELSGIAADLRGEYQTIVEKPLGMT